MIIAVGSRNRTKVLAVQDICYEYKLWRGAEVNSVDVHSGVSSQPMSLEETIRGARNRAVEAIAALTFADWGVGIEGGLIPLPGSVSGYGAITFCSIYTQAGQFALGASPLFEHPAKVIECVLQERVDISEAYKRCGLTEISKLGDAMGAVGLLTSSRMDRTAYTKQAIMMALTRLENPKLYE